jgi:hypothetical protein
MGIDELERHEQMVLGGLLRMMVRSDGKFTEGEESEIDALGNGIGGRDAIWKIVSQSAQELPNDERIKAAVKSVIRPEARATIRAAIEKIAHQGGIVAAERRLLDWLGGEWRS